MNLFLISSSRVCLLFALLAFGFTGYAEYAHSHEAPVAPCFESFIALPDGVVEIHGKAAGFVHVELVSGADRIGETDVAEEEKFRIRLVQTLKHGEYRFVLRSIDKQGHSATSLQTLVVSMPEKNRSGALALLEEPGKVSRLISGQKSAGRAVVFMQDDFAVEKIIFQQGKLTICGKRPAGMRVSVISGDRIIGSEHASASGNDTFCIIRNHALETGDYIFRAELTDITGNKIDAVSLPFSIKNSADTTRQIYHVGQPVDTIIVRRGESLSRIARRVYGNSAFAKALFEANHDKLRSFDEVYAGQELVLPLAGKRKGSKTHP